MLTPQKIFDTVATHLFTQGERSYDRSDPEVCLYRGPNGLKCAVGVLIPDELYDPEMEGLAAWHAIPHESDLFENIELLRSLQHVHDDQENWKTTDYMRTELYSVANEFDIDPAILYTLSFKDR